MVIGQPFLFQCVHEQGHDRFVPAFVQFAERSEIGLQRYDLVDQRIESVRNFRTFHPQVQLQQRQPRLAGLLNGYRDVVSFCRRERDRAGTFFVRIVGQHLEPDRGVFHRRFGFGRENPFFGRFVDRVLVSDVCRYFDGDQRVARFEVEQLLFDDDAFLGVLRDFHAFAFGAAGYGQRRFARFVVGGVFTDRQVYLGFSGFSFQRSRIEPFAASRNVNDFGSPLSRRFQRNVFVGSGHRNRPVFFRKLERVSFARRFLAFTAFVEHDGQNSQQTVQNYFFHLIIF